MCCFFPVEILIDRKIYSCKTPKLMSREHGGTCTNVNIKRCVFLWNEKHLVSTNAYKQMIEEQQPPLCIGFYIKSFVSIDIPTKPSYSAPYCQHVTKGWHGNDLGETLSHDFLCVFLEATDEKKQQRTFKVLFECGEWGQGSIYKYLLWQLSGDPERCNEGKYEILRTVWLTLLIRGSKIHLT